MDFYSVNRESLFSKKAKTAIAIILAAVILLLIFIFRDKVVPGWHEDKNGIYHISLIGKDTGLKRIGNEYYMFSYKGYLLYGWNSYGGFSYYSDENGKVLRTQYTVDGTLYNFDESDGRLYTGTRIVDGKLYYFDEYGFKKYGVVCINGDYFSFNTKGALDYGLKEVDGKTYYFNSQGIAQTGLQSVDGRTYFFGDDGAQVIGRYIDEDGLCWFYDEDGMKLYGWQSDSSSGIKSYYYEDGSIPVGEVEIDGETFAFDSNGALI